MDSLLCREGHPWNQRPCVSINTFCTNMFVMVHVVKIVKLVFTFDAPIVEMGSKRSPTKVFHVEEERKQLNKTMNYHGNSVISLKWWGLNFFP